MNKVFLEVFPSLVLEEKIKKEFDEAYVERLVFNRKQVFFKVFFSSRYLIEKRIVCKVEQEISRQLFPDMHMTVILHEKYMLSAQYTPENLMGLYWDSILYEFRNADPVAYAILKKSGLKYPDASTVCLVLEDSVISRTKADDIREIIWKIINERCGLKANVVIEYKEKVNSNKDIRYSSEETALIKDQKPMEEKAKTVVADNNSFRKKTPGLMPGNNKKPYQRAANSDDDDLFYGRRFDGETIPIGDITGEIGEATIRGKVITYDRKDIRGDRALLMFGMTDFTDSIMVKLFVRQQNIEELEKKIAVGKFLKLKGMAVLDRFDHEVCIQSVVGIKSIPDFTPRRTDNAPIKRIELHCHTKMSDMDGVSNVEDIIDQAYEWGMPGIAITDHAVVQGLPVAYRHLDSMKKKNQEMRPFNVLLGVEGYLVDDFCETVINPNGQDLTDRSYVVFDIKTTGPSPIKHKIIEICAIKVRNNEAIERFSKLVNPQVPIPATISRKTGISDDMVENAPVIDTVFPEFMSFCENYVLIGHDIRTQAGFITENGKRLGINSDYTYMDTMGLSRVFLPKLRRQDLDSVCKALGIIHDSMHRAFVDAESTEKIYKAFQTKLEEKSITNVDRVKDLEKLDPEAVKRLRSYHVIILAKNVEGRTNLYTLISKSHLEYFYRKPIIPKSELLQYRDGLVIGSACCAGELMNAIIEGKNEEELAKLVDFYDYLEIQPIDNNRFMISSDKDVYADIKSDEDLRELNRQIVRLGEQYGKPVVATCDAHFLNPEDEIYRRIIMSVKDMDDEDPAPLYLRTTDEMLKEFDYLGTAKAKEVVVDNTNIVFGWFDNVSPVRPDKCPPVIENSDEQLRKICYDRVKEIYGENLPTIVSERLEKELTSIIGNGYAVLYIIAQKLVWKSLKDGYLVGSRGSVGSSFVAYAAGITEVNSLAPHYICPKCKYSDFDSEDVKKYAGNSGCDMPDKICPICGTKLRKDGYDIPFETFLGFKGDKEPDIDLNFSGEYQPRAHKYTEEIFGHGQTFRAGTIGSVAEKTAYGFVKQFLEKNNEVKRKAEIERLAQGCVGIRRNTGQHPGGIVVLPVGENIHSFTPIQHPANDMTSPIVTTHFDYHSIDHNLLKLDILGHDDPTMIRFLQDCTGIDPKNVPLDDKDVMELFKSTKSIGVTPEQLGGTMLGCLALPEFGTDFAMNMVLDAKPQSFSDLIRLSGLSHGTNVWIGNAKDLIDNGIATLSSCICCRDDIMVYLIQKGMDKSLSFKTMESVRKGKGLSEEMEAAMRAVDVPDWYIDSCKKIKYMFPKAHAAAYVMMAWRIGYYKVHLPQAFYAAWFSIRAKSLNYEHMFQGLSNLRYYMREYGNKQKENTITPAEKDELAAMRVVEEMYERGIEVLPIDIYKADAKSFTVVGDKIMPSLVSLGRLGENVARQIAEAAKNGAFTSREDFRNRTKCPQVIIDNMYRLGLFGDLPESSQLSIFDLFELNG